MTFINKIFIEIDNVVVKVTLKNTQELNLGVLFTFYRRNKQFIIKITCLFHQLTFYVYPNKTNTN
jgi:hypothetical protein